MSSLKGHKNPPVITYSRKTSGRMTTKVTASQIQMRTTKKQKTDEMSRGFWDFVDSSDEEALPANEVTVKPVTVVSEVALKRKAIDVDGERLGKKAWLDENGRSRSSTPVDARRQPKQTTEGGQVRLQSPQPVTPRKSNLIARSNIKTAPSPPIHSRQRTPQPLSTPPCPTTPKPRSEVHATPPRESPKQSITPTKRLFSRVNSSPLSTPPSSRNSISRRLPTTPSPQSRLKTRSGTFTDFSSPKMTPKQAETWESLPITEDSSPSRRRLVDKLREQASRTPDKSRTPPPIPTISTPSITIEDEISRILEYPVPTLEETRPRKEVSQSDSQGTYLSRSRSFLADAPAQETLAFEEFWRQPSEEQRPSQVEEEEDYGVKSWHELKRGGKDKRIIDEMEDLIEECKPGGRLGLRRLSILQVVEKLINDVTWRRKFKGLGLMSNFIQNVQDAYTDPILLLTTLLAIDLIPKPVPPTVAAEVLILCLEGLREDRNLGTLASLRSLGVSKILKSELLSLQTKSKILPEVLTSQHLALNIVIDLRVSDIHPLCVFLGEFTDIYQWKILAAIAGSLEKSTQGRVITGLKGEDIQEFNPILQKGLSEFETDVVLRKATLSFLRACINLTNSSGEICEYLNPDTTLSTILTKIITADPARFSDADYRNDTTSNDDISSNHAEEHEKRESRFEVLLLSLGLMINFVQESDKVKDSVLKSSLSNDIRKIFEKLISREEPANHALGYLALLLAHLIIPSPSGNAIIVKKETRKWVERLLDDFVGIHRVVQSQSQEEGERKDVEGMAGEVEKVLLLLRTR